MELKLNKQKLSNLPSNISKISNLRNLELDDDKLDDISVLKYCTKLIHLSAPKNSINVIHSTLGGVAKLRK